jgi:hypothetical protein
LASLPALSVVRSSVRIGVKLRSHNRHLSSIGRSDGRERPDDGHFHKLRLFRDRGVAHTLVSIRNRLEGWFRLLIAVLFSAALYVAPVAAQKNEISFSVGGGSLIGADESRGARVGTLAYTRYLTERWAVEGSLEFFSVNIPNFGRDGFAGVQGSVLYHLRPAATDRRLVPYLTAGFGKTTTDFTEIPSEWVIRLGGGFKYFVGQSQKFGLRVEARNEIIGENNRIFFPPTRINFPSARFGVVYRF